MRVAQCIGMLRFTSVAGVCWGTWSGLSRSLATISRGGRTLPASVVLAAAGVLLLLAQARAAPQRIKHGELQQLLDQLVAAGAPGAAARVEDAGGIRQAASGVADLRTRRPMQPWLQFRAGSVTKSFVATVVLQLAAEGRLSLSDTVERWLPGILPYGDQVIIRQLLQHTGGVPDYVPTVWRALYGSRQGRWRTWTPRELVALVAGRPPEFPPGTAWSYSNTGYVLLGLVVEAVTGRELGQELAGRLFGPLGLRHTFFPVNSPAIPRPRSHGYSLPLGPQGNVRRGPLPDFTRQNPSYAWAAGALVSTLADLGRFFRALLGGRLLPPELLAEMLTTVAVPPGVLPVPLYDRYGLGLFTIETPAGPAFVGKISELFARKERGRTPPFGKALDLGTGSGIWAIELAQRGWQVTGVDVIEHALRRARDRARKAGVAVQFVRGDVTALRAAGIGSGYRLVLDTGTWHDFDVEQQQAMGREIAAVAAPEATVLLYVWTKHRRPLIRGASRAEIEAAFPGWQVTDVEAAHFRLPTLLEWVLKPDDHWYTLRRT